MNDKIWCYLTAEADVAVKELVKAGFDQDLALAVLERLWREEEIYDIPTDDVEMTYVKNA